MDPITELYKLVAAEDRAKMALDDAKFQTRRLVGEHVVPLLKSGLIKLTINREQMRRMNGEPVEAILKRGDPRL